MHITARYMTVSLCGEKGLAEAKKNPKTAPSTSAVLRFSEKTLGM